MGDVVLAADGVRSTGRTIVLGYEDKPKSSGYAVYRAWFEVGRLKDDPELNFVFQNPDEIITVSEPPPLVSFFVLLLSVVEEMFLQLTFRSGLVSRISCFVT